MNFLMAKSEAFTPGLAYHVPLLRLTLVEIIRANVSAGPD